MFDSLPDNAGDDLMDAKPSLLALTPVVRCVPVPMQVVTWYSGFARHKDPMLDAAGALADLLVFSLNLTGLDILQKIQNQDNSWWAYRVLFKDLWHADKKQDRNALAKPLLNILQQVEGNPVVKSKVLHLFRDSGVILLASGGAGMELLQIWGDFAALYVPAPAEWVDAIFPRVRALLDTVQERNARMQTGKRQADDLMSDKAAEGFLQTVLYSGICFWQNLPFRTQRYGMAYVLHRLPAAAQIIMTQEYLSFAQQAMTSHDRANKQAEMDDSDVDVLALPAPAQVPAPEVHVAPSAEAQACTTDFIQQFVKQQSQQGAMGKLTGEKGYKSVGSGSRYHFIIGLVIDSGSKTVQMEITKGHHYQCLAPLHQYVLDSLGFERGSGPVFSYEDVDAIMLHEHVDAINSFEQLLQDICLKLGAKMDFTAGVGRGQCGSIDFCLHSRFC
ncbi:TPA: hypothetical protein ACH3X1_009257 [Trebouxia sp. C0004]